MSDTAARSRVLVVAAGIVAAEGVALVGLSLSYVGLILAGHPHNRGLALFGAGIGLLFGAGLIVASRALRVSRRAAYSPILLAQLIAIPVGIGLVQGGRTPVAIAVLVPSAVVLALLVFTPSGRAVVSGE
ncbi:MAG: hypothetical protein ACJ735_17300 [Actinomycetes bacterium]